MDGNFSKHFKIISRSIRTRLLILKDSFEILVGKRNALIPPKRYDYINIGSNNEINKEFFNYFLEKGGLKESDKVLEIGSGFGRMAIPLTEFLSKEGHYNGLELIKDGVNWCKSNFTKRFPNFEFQRIDVFNDRYNPLGKQLASTYKFPFEDDSFDFIYLTSVFTHMYSDEIKNYIKEISRVLKKGGKCLITYYILNETSLNNIKESKGTYNFKFEIDDYRVEDMFNPLYQIAFKESFIRDWYSRFNLVIQEPIYYGSWSGRQDYLSFQDIIIGKKS